MLNWLEKYRPKVAAAVTFPDVSVAFTAIHHFRMWGSLFPGDHLPPTIYPHRLRQVVSRSPKLLYHRHEDMPGTLLLRIPGPQSQQV